MLRMNWLESLLKTLLTQEAEVTASATVPSKMGRKFDTQGCLTKIFIKRYMICMITPGMLEKGRKHSKPAKLRAHAFTGIVRQ